MPANDPNPSMRDVGAQGVHELGGGFRLPPNPANGWSAANTKPEDSPAFEHPNPTGAPNVQRWPHPERDQPARVGTHPGTDQWLNVQHRLDIAGQTMGRAVPPPPDRPATARVAMTVRDFDAGMGRSEWAGGLHGVVPSVDGQPVGRQNPIDVNRPTFRVPPKPWEDTVPAIGA